MHYDSDDIGAIPIIGKLMIFLFNMTSFFIIASYVYFFAYSQTILIALVVFSLIAYAFGYVVNKISKKNVTLSGIAKISDFTFYYGIIVVMGIHYFFGPQLALNSLIALFLISRIAVPAFFYKAICERKTLKLGPFGEYSAFETPKSTVNHTPVKYAEALKKINHYIIHPLEDKTLAKTYGLNNCALLFYGHVESGELFEQIKNILETTEISFYCVKTTNLLSNGEIEGVKYINEIFTIARIHAPYLVFFPSFHLLAPDGPAMQELAYQLKENKGRQDKVFVICTVDELSDLPPIIGEHLFDAKIEIRDKVSKKKKVGSTFLYK